MNTDLALFRDWCAARVLPAMPSTWSTIERFITDLPAAPGTLARRVREIQRAHTEAGHIAPAPPPPVLEPPDPRLGSTLARLQVYGWSEGLRGRRDGFLLVLAAGLRLTRAEIRALPIDSITVAPVRIGGRIVERGDTPGECSACAVTRWLRILALATHRGWPGVRNVMSGRWAEVAADQTSHDCMRPVPAGWRSATALVLAVDQHGHPGDVTMSSRSITSIRSEIGKAVVTEPVASREPAERDQGPSGWTVARAVTELADLDPVLDELDVEIDAAMARVEALLRG